MSWEISIEDVYAVIKKHGLRKNKSQLDQILSELDCAQIEQRADVYDDYREQQEAVNAEIERQLILNAIIPRTNEPLFSSPPEPEMTPQFIMRYFNRVPGEGKFVLHMNEEFFQRLMDALEGVDFSRVDEREELGPFVSSFLEQAESVFSGDDEESKTVDVGGARFKISLFDSDYFDLNLNKVGILMLQTALKVISRRETLDGAVWNFFKRIRAIVDQQEHGTFDRQRVPFPLPRPRNPTRNPTRSYA
jgi:hypothetical protein